MGETLDQVVGSYESGKAPKHIFGMTPAESAAVVNLVHHIPQAAAISILAKLVSDRSSW